MSTKRTKAKRNLRVVTPEPVVVQEPASELNYAALIGIEAKSEADRQARERQQLEEHFAEARTIYEESTPEQRSAMVAALRSQGKKTLALLRTQEHWAKNELRERGQSTIDDLNAFKADVPLTLRQKDPELAEDMTNLQKLADLVQKLVEEAEGSDRAVLVDLSADVTQMIYDWRRFIEVLSLLRDSYGLPRALEVTAPNYHLRLVESRNKVERTLQRLDRIPAAIEAVEAVIEKSLNKNPAQRLGHHPITIEISGIVRQVNAAADSALAAASEALLNNPQRLVWQLANSFRTPPQTSVVPEPPMQIDW